MGVGYRAEAQGPSALAPGPRVQPPRRGRTPPRESPSRCPGPPGSLVKGIDKEAVGQVAATFAPSASPSPTRARACSYAGERVLRKAGKAGKKYDEQHLQATPRARKRRHHRVRKKITGTARSSPPGRVPVEPAPGAAGDRRRSRPHPGRRLHLEPTSEPRARPATWPWRPGWRPVGERAKAAGRQQGRVRSWRFPLPRPGQAAGRRRRQRTGVLMAHSNSLACESRGSSPSTVWPRWSRAAGDSRSPRSW